MKSGNRISWMQMACLIIAMLAIGTASIYVTHITDGNADHFDWFMVIVLTLIGVSNAVQFFTIRKNDHNRK